MNTVEISRICQQLVDEGKKPSVALIKARLPNSIPLPIIINSLQKWRSNPMVELAESELKNVTTGEKITLEHRIESLEKEVEYLKSLILK